MKLIEAYSTAEKNTEIIEEGTRLKAAILGSLLALSGTLELHAQSKQTQPQKIKQVVKAQKPLKIQKTKDGICYTILSNGKIMAVVKNIWAIYSSDMSTEEASGTEGNYSFSGSLAKEYVKALNGLFAAARG